jgi:DNA-binding GntR family transcriptional regulator
VTDADQAQEQLPPEPVTPSAEAPGRSRMSRSGASVVGNHLDRKPMGSVVYEAIRDAIVEGRYEPDEKLIQEQVATDLGVSRTPVRDALNRLAHEGLVTWSPGYGYVVNELTDEAIDEMHQVRELLEERALMLSCGRLDRVQAARMRALIEEMDAGDPTDVALQFSLNQRFHQAMIEPCGNRFLTFILDQLWNHPVSRRITRSYVHDPRNVSHMVDEHRAILQASLDDDPDRLAQLSRSHMAEGYRQSHSAER